MELIKQYLIESISIDDDTKEEVTTSKPESMPDQHKHTVAQDTM